MYNKIIIDRLNNLTHLSALKNSNATAISKKNPYGDIVKFYAQINKNNVIQAITFKATGCSYFIALSSYFCEIVEGKTIDEALKIKEKDLIAFAELDESKHHIYPIILGTFALLIKKYRKGLELGKIKPCEVKKATKVEVKKRVSSSKTIDIKEGLGEILVNDTKKVSATSKKVTGTKQTKVTTTTVITETSSSVSVEEKKAITAIEKREREIALKEAKQQAKLEKLEKKAQAKEEKKLAKESASAKKSLAVEKANQVKVIEKQDTAKFAKKESSLAKATKTAETKKVSVSAGINKTMTKKSDSVKTEIVVAEDKKAESKVAKTTKPATKKTTATAKSTKPVLEDKKKLTKTTANKETKAVVSAKISEKKSAPVKTQALVKTENDVIVSDSIPSTSKEETQNQIIVEHVEHKRRVETIRKGGSTQTIEAERLDALKLNAEGKDVRKEVHSAANLNDMLSRLNASKTTKVNNLEVRSDASAKKTIDGKVVDTKSTSNSFSSMRDSLHRMRINNETKALPSTNKEVEKKTEKKEETQKKGLFSRLFRR